MEERDGFRQAQEAYGKVTINPNWCKGCGFCVNFSPTDALEMSSSYNAKGYHPPKIKSAEDCRDCKFCKKFARSSLFTSRPMKLKGLNSGALS